MNYTSTILIQIQNSSYSWDVSFRICQERFILIKPVTFAGDIVADNPFLSSIAILPKKKAGYSTVRADLYRLSYVHIYEYTILSWHLYVNNSGYSDCELPTLVLHNFSRWSQTVALLLSAILICGLAIDVDFA